MNLGKRLTQRRIIPISINADKIQKYDAQYMIDLACHLMHWELVS